MPKLNIHTVIGDDDFLVRNRAKEIHAELAEKYPDEFSRETIDGKAERVEDALRILNEAKGATQTLSLFGDGKLVWLNEIDFLNQSRTGGSESCKDALEEAKEHFSKLPEGVSLLLSATPVHRSHGFIKWLQKNTEFEDLKSKDSRGNPSFASFRLVVRETAQACSVEITSEATELLCAKIAGNVRLAAEEIRKLACYLGEETNQITEKHVAELVPEFGETDFFEAAEAFSSGDLNWALEAIDRYFFHGKDARPLLSSLQNRNRLLIQLRVLIDAREIRPNAKLNKQDFERLSHKHASHFADPSQKSALNVFSQNPWYLGRLLPAATKFSTRALIDFQARFIKTFEDLISVHKDDQAALLKQLAVQCLGKDKG